jgi:hypothetical protein
MPVVGRHVDPEGRSDEEIDRTIAEGKIEHPELYGRERGRQREGPGPDGPPSRGGGR